MKKYFLILPLVLSIFMIGCNSGEKAVQTNIEETQNSSGSKDNKDNKDSKDTLTIDKSAEDKTSTNNTENEDSTNKTEDKKGTSNSEGAIFIDVKTVDKTSTFPFGMSQDNVKAKLKELKLEVINEIEITSSEDDPEWGNKVVISDGISFSFDKSNKLYGINVTENIPTSLGLKKGASLVETEKLYGKGYNKYKVENGLVYEYTFNSHYFKVFIEGDKVAHWAVSKYKFLK